MEIDQSPRFTKIARNCHDVDKKILFVFPQHIPDSMFILLATALCVTSITAFQKINAVDVKDDFAETQKLLESGFGAAKASQENQRTPHVHI